MDKSTGSVVERIMGRLEADEIPGVSLYDLAPALQNEFFVARFVRARKGDEEAALKLLVECIKWRGRFLDGIVSPVQEFLQSHKGKFLLRIWPSRDTGNSGTGHPVMCEHLVLFSPKELLKHFTLDECVYVHISIMERQLARCYEQQTSGFIYIGNLDGVTMGHVRRWIIDLLRRLAQIDGDYYPETCKYVFLINAPLFFEKIYNGLIAKLLDETTRKKIHICGREDSLSQMQRMGVGLENIPAAWGGSWKDWPFGQVITGSLDSQEDDRDDASLTEDEEIASVMKEYNVPALTTSEQ